MTLTMLDHVAVVSLALLFPLWDRHDLRKSAARIDGGDRGHRTTVYRKILVWEWCMAAGLAAMWIGLERTAADLGLVPVAGLVPLVGYALAASWCVLMAVQMRSLMATAEGRASMRESLGSMSFLLPRTSRERRWFGAVSVTAGFCEELIYRGYLMAYFVALLEWPGWGAALLSSVVFGMAHMYQGATGMLRTGAIGAAFAGLYLLTGSIWAPILCHMAMDIVSGRIGCDVFREGDGDKPGLAA